METRELLDDIEHRICQNKLTREQVFTKMKCIIQTLERSDKLPSYEDIIDNWFCANKERPSKKQFYETLKKLGNFT
jgi:hypothetical protein